MVLVAGCIVDAPTYVVPMDGAEPDAATDGATDPCVAAGGQIVFTTNRDGDNEIARMFADGSGFAMLTSNAWDDSFPTLSHDGRFVAWYSSPAGMGQLNVASADGSDPHAITGVVAFNDFSTWSPVMDRLAVAASGDIYAVDASGAGLGNLTSSPELDTDPSWAPDGSKLVFHSENGLFTVNSDGTGQAQIRDGGGSPKWSPTGTYIAFAAIDGLARMSPSGQSEALIFPGSTSGFDWAPDGSALVVGHRTAISSGDIHVVSHVAGKASVQLTTTGKEFEPRWSPDGSRIVFSSNRDGNFEIHVMNADGSSQVNLTMDAGGDGQPDWAPCP